MTVLAADYLVVELDIDVVVFVPTDFVETVFVEVQRAVEFAVDVGCDAVVYLSLVLSPRQLPYIDNVVADAGNEFDAQILCDVYLLYLVLPEFACHYSPCQRRDVVAGV